MSVAAEPDLFTVDITEDPHAFLAAAQEHLALDPVLTTVVSSVTNRAPWPRSPPAWRHPRTRAGGQWCATPPVSWPAPRCGPRRSRRTRCSCCRCPRAPPGRSPVRCTPAARIRAAPTARCRPPRSSPRRPRRWSAATRRSTSTSACTRFGELVEPRPVPGRLRVSDGGRRRAGARLVRGVRGRRGRAGRPDRGDPRGRRAPHLDDSVERIDGDRVWLWEDETGQVVHMTGFSPPCVRRGAGRPGVHAA